MKKISQDTLIPIGFAISIIGGGAMWMTKTTDAVAAHETRLNEGKKKYEHQIDRINEALQSLDRKLSIIEGELKRIRR